MPLQPPLEAGFDSCEALLILINTFAKGEGYTIVKRYAYNYKDGQACRFDLAYDMGGLIRPSIVS